MNQTKQENSNRIVILHILPSLFLPAGTPRKLYSLVKNTDSGKYRHVFLLFDNHPNNLCDQIESAGGIIEEVHRPGNYDIRLIYDIIRMVRSRKVDIINTHFARADIFGAIAGKLCGVPVIKSVHGIVWNASTLITAIDRLVAPLRYLTTCNSRASLVAEKGRSRAKNIEVIYNGVLPRITSPASEAAAMSREKLGLPPDCFLIGHIGGLIELRRQDLIIESIHKLVKHDVDAYCVIAGNGPEEKRLKDYAKSLDMVDRILFLGYFDDVAGLLKTFDVYVNMARLEGFGIAVVEAMFAGLPVVLADSGALPELIVDNESGLLVREGSSNALTDALLRLVGDTSLRLKLGKAAGQRADEKFSIRRFVKDMETIYTKCYLDKKQ